MKRRGFSFYLLVLMFCMLFPICGQAKVKAPKKQCHAYVVMDAGSGKVLFGQDQDKVIYPASTAKMMTSIVCLEKEKNLKRKVKTEYDIVYGTTLGTYSLGIGAGVKYSIRDLMAMSLVSSAADATDSLAVAVFGSKKACVEAMNAKCEEMGLKNTHFDNPVGSDIGAGYKETYATATEMALIARYAMSKDTIRDLVKRAHYTTSNGRVTANSTNSFLRGMAWYDRNKYQIIGTKSGTTNAAGNVFIATAKDKKGHEVICAYFGNVSKESTFASIRSLLDYTFAQYKKGKLTLTPANYDVRCGKTFGPVYTKYAALNVYPGGTDGKFHKNKAITRKELGKMVKGINELKACAPLEAFVSGNYKGQVTAAKLAMMVQKIYPSYLSQNKVDEILADVPHADTLNDAERQAFAVYLKEGLYPDEYSKNPCQVITRKEAVLFCDGFRAYQDVYEMIHGMSRRISEQEELTFTKSAEAMEAEAKEAEKNGEKKESTDATVEEQTTESLPAEGQTEADVETLQVKCLQPGITIVSAEWAAKMEAYHAEQEAAGN